MHKQRFRPGQKVEHPSFGTGLVIEVKPGERFDVLEVAFPSGTRRLSSLTPQLEPAGGKPAAASARTPSPPPQRQISDDTPAAEEMNPPAVLQPEAPSIQFLDSSPALLALLEKGEFEAPGVFRLRLRAEELAREQGFHRLMCLPSLSGVDRFPHQEAAALRTLREMRGRAILADEVGLGKTIEAGMILKEYLVRGLVRRILVLCPASLLFQWQEEMSGKFGLHFEVQQTGQDWSDAPLLISSLERAKMPSRRDAVMESRYDLVAVDEAHRLRNQRTQSRQLVAELAPRHLLLLTATPVQNDLRELYNLVSLVRPGALGTWAGFRAQFMTRGDARMPTHPERLRSLLQSVMIRNTRASAGLTWSKRRVEIRTVRMGEAERAFYDEVGSYAFRTLQQAGTRAGGHLPMLVLEKELGSSVQAALRTLHVLARKTAAGTGELKKLTELAAEVKDQAKLTALLEILESDGAQVVVFTQFMATLEYLRAELEARGIPVEIFHGGLTERAKEDAITRFRDRVRVLLSTEAGGEGRNLQFCHRMVNYDLPWNPMRVEQRIGRIHRLGQEHDVEIYNLAAEDTIEGYVIETLYRKIRLFELVVGEVEDILSQLGDDPSIEDRVFRAWNSSERPEIRRKKFEQLAEEIAAAQRSYEQARELDAAILDD